MRAQNFKLERDAAVRSVKEVEHTADEAEHRVDSALRAVEVDELVEDFVEECAQMVEVECKVGVLFLIFQEFVGEVEVEDDVAVFIVLFDDEDEVSVGVCERGITQFDIDVRERIVVGDLLEDVNHFVAGFVRNA